LTSIRRGNGRVASNANVERGIEELEGTLLSYCPCCPVCYRLPPTQTQNLMADTLTTITNLINSPPSQLPAGWSMASLLLATVEARNG
jgi:hypothetical protein